LIAAPSSAHTYAGAVVLDTDLLQAAFFDGDDDARATGIECILEQLLDSLRASQSASAQLA
jgi:hypothetical protein